MAAGGRRRRISDAELREALEAGRSPREIAGQFGVTRQAVSKRIAQLGLTTTAAVVAPEESRRYARSQLDALERLTEALPYLDRLLAACDEWLRDPDQPERYDVGARAEEITVVYLDETGERPVRKKALLSRLLSEAATHPDVSTVLRAESKHADPRELILSTLAELRHTMRTGVELAERLADARRIERIAEAIVTAVSRVDPVTARAIAEEIRRDLVLCAGPGQALPVPA